LKNGLNLNNEIEHKTLLILSAVKSHSRQRIVLEDPDDDKFFHLAIKSGAQYIVSRDVHLLNIKEFGGVKLLRPEVFLSALKRGYL
jgi:predicted nucleic acid-binding protein